MLGDFTSRTVDALGLVAPGHVQMRTPPTEASPVDVRPILYSFGVPRRNIALTRAEWYADEDFEPGPVEEEKSILFEVVAGNQRQETLASERKLSGPTASANLQAAAQPLVFGHNTQDIVLWKVTLEAHSVTPPQGLLVMKFEYI